jgi:GTPase
VARVRVDRAVSAETGDGVDRLERVLLDLLPEGEPLYDEDYLTDQPERAIVAETVREKVLIHTRAELPFSTAVVVDQFDEEARERAPAALLHHPRRAASRRSRSSSAAAAR